MTGPDTDLPIATFSPFFATTSVRRLAKAGKAGRERDQALEAFDLAFRRRRITKQLLRGSPSRQRLRDSQPLVFYTMRLPAPDVVIFDVS